VAGVLAVLTVAFSVATARLFIWPDLPPLPDHADVIIELGGPGPRRAMSYQLAREGRAPVLAISTTEDQLGMSWCDESRVPGVTVLCFRPDPFTTRGEARYIAQLAQQHGWDSIILVTSTSQAWRATVRVGRCFDGDVYVATVDLPAYRWPGEILYQWGATAKAFTLETDC
jgi:uncharacterized SAM-binding protein YcdF (DUF218 family)